MERATLLNVVELRHDVLNLVRVQVEKLRRHLITFFLRHFSYKVVRHLRLLIAPNNSNILGEFEEVGYLGRVVLFDLLIEAEFHWDHDENSLARPQDFLDFAEEYAAVLANVNMEMLLHLRLFVDDLLKDDTDHVRPKPISRHVSPEYFLSNRANVLNPELRVVVVQKHRQNVQVH